MKINIKQKKYFRSKYKIIKNSNLRLKRKSLDYLKFEKYFFKGLFDIKSTYHE